tara:strand:- start:1630 stop:2034 length:405 start_codon:yes stop_codon:yes gene_type:complete
MAVTTDNVRDLLNRPRGLLEGTINEYISIRTLEINKTARSSTLFGVTAENAVSTDLKEAVIKTRVAVDCLLVLIDTIPSYYTEEDGRYAEQRFREQLKEMSKRADDLYAQVREVGGTAFSTKSTTSRLSGDNTV